MWKCEPPYFIQSRSHSHSRVCFKQSSYEEKKIHSITEHCMNLCNFFYSVFACGSFFYTPNFAFTALNVEIYYSEKRLCHANFNFNECTNYSRSNFKEENILKITEREKKRTWRSFSKNSREILCTAPEKKIGATTTARIIYTESHFAMPFIDKQCSRALIKPTS